MKLSRAFLVALPAERISRTDAAICKAAKNVVKKLRNKRDIKWETIESKSPRDLVRHIAENIGSELPWLQPTSSP